MEKMATKKFVLIFLITIIVCFIYSTFKVNIVTGKSNFTIEIEDELESNPPLLIYKERYKETQKQALKKVGVYPKEVFLTFDDGPSINNTLNILDILNKNNVKATFFIIGQKAEEHPEIIKMLNASGMCIASHTYTHNYDRIYVSQQNYILDMEKCNAVIKKLTNKSNFSYIRMPGGSDNLVSNGDVLKQIKIDLKKKNINYVDWNVSSDDAMGYNIPASKLIKNVITKCENQSMAVILMHDSYYKKTTVDSLQEVITYLKKQGYVFRTFNDLTETEKQKMIKKEVLNR